MAATTFSAPATAAILSTATRKDQRKQEAKWNDSRRPVVKHTIPNGYKANGSHTTDEGETAVDKSRHKRRMNVTHNHDTHNREIDAHMHNGSTWQQ